MARHGFAVVAFAAALLASGCSSAKSDAGGANANCGGAGRACLIGAVVTAATADEPIPVGITGATVSLADGTPLGTANAGGWFFVKGVPAGSGVQVCFAAAGFARRCRNVTAAGGQNVQLSNTGLADLAETAAAAADLGSTAGDAGAQPAVEAALATGRVLDTAGAPVWGALVTCGGASPDARSGASEAYTEANGSFRVPVGAGSFTCAARKGAFAGAPRRGTPAAATAPGAGAGIAVGDFTLTDPLARIVLTWGALPSDLDSHLVGADWASPGGIHVWYDDQGSLTQAPWADRDTDATDGFGPEITSVVHGVKAQRYRFCVHAFSRDGSLAGSSAAVDAFLGGDHVRVEVPSAAAKQALWRVLEFTVDAAGNATHLRVIDDLVDAPLGVEAACMQ
jgi:hypothetical protein